mmetsp:Transcript_2233/g.4604  ORF Transcript_2233/g.4604 Transcript_2233/m.4604 type:complete len:152 (-) Transcript_2233:445-900(-)
MNQETLAKLQSRANAVRTGGKGSVRRKKKAPMKTTAADDKKLQATVRRLGVQPIPGIEEANFFKKDGKVLHFVKPKVQANFNAGITVVNGPSKECELQELLPGIIEQMGTNSIEDLKRLVANFSRANIDVEKKDEEIPELEGADFEETAKE